MLKVVCLSDDCIPSVGSTDQTLGIFSGNILGNVTMYRISSQSLRLGRFADVFPSAINLELVRSD